MHKFRWCTERLKIKPSNSFINSVVKASGEAILVLGTKKAEGISRARNMTKHESGRVRDRLSPSSSMPGSLVYTPIEDWSNDDAWMLLMQVPNAWGYSNKDLLGMYAGASADGECPLVVDSSTPSCGDSRFGSWAVFELGCPTYRAPRQYRASKPCNAAGRGGWEATHFTPLKTNAPFGSQKGFRGG